ncbi:hypothetical protein [Delftia sp. GW456-R20]|uniref:hypothetical protein n=1 Tax=Delftia sp. GW456-R20 TaxID=1827145 RepID=UPI0012E97D43|nr:hypothetical protein [Delftia sp. GW456-R20]
MSWPAGQLAQHQALARPGRRRRRPQLVDELDQDLQLVDVLATAAQRRRRAQLVDELDQDLQLVVVVATAAQRAGLVVDLHVWANWSSTRRWPGLGGAAAGRSWSMSSTRTCSCSVCWPRPRYAPPAGTMLDQPAAARCGGDGHAAAPPAAAGR